ncbi:MAG: PPC domain-containing protein [Chloroflexi bacterium]|nr:PPC domain-containing protein [Chloroflexota bacterium]
MPAANKEGNFILAALWAVIAVGVAIGVFYSHADDLADAAPVTVGQPVQGAIDPIDDVDIFRFTAQAGQLYQIDVELGTLDGFSISLLDGNRRRLKYEWMLEYNADSGEPIASRHIVWAAPDSDDYYVALGGAPGTGSYTLNITGIDDYADDYANDIAGATGTAPVTVGQPVQGALNYRSDVDVFRFTPQAGQSYYIAFERGTGIHRVQRPLRSAALARGDTRLWDAAGDTVGYGGGVGYDLYAPLVWEAPIAGDFYISVSDSFTDRYNLNVSPIDLIVVENPVQGAIDPIDEVDVFRFTAQAGQLYQFELELGTLDDSEMELLHADGSTLVPNAYHRAGGQTIASRHIVWAAPDSGDYYVVIGGWAGTGSYTLKITQR